ncbi:hypothetical protein BDA96_05G104400 [Sorghum bicolor]|uniref:Uncharacterized protein n=1 Tax=Sorghum bicolor TaxID=4558 RepID=A0A921QYL2_SORBI|nr:hypothetical protein BDA96_05G104400 [Sorghum bicolor]
MPLHGSHGYGCFSLCRAEMIIRFVRSAVWHAVLTRSKKCSCQQARTRGVRVCVWQRMSPQPPHV